MKGDAFNKDKKLETIINVNINEKNLLKMNTIYSNCIIVIVNFSIHDISFFNY